MNDRLTSEIERIRSDKAIPALDEANVKQGVILRILNILGWDTFNTNEVRPEYPVQGGNVDYSLRIQGANRVFLEAKRPSEDLRKHQVQLLNYSFADGVPLAVLTNGLNWWFYLPLQVGSWEERRFGEIDLRNPDVSQTTTRLTDFLSKENVSLGIAVKNAESHLATLWKARKTEEILPKAWEQVRIDLDDILVELLSDEVNEMCGWQPDTDQVKRFLDAFMKPVLISPTPSAPPVSSKHAMPKQPNQSFGSYNGTKIVRFTFHGQTYGPCPWTRLLITLAEQLHQLHPSEFQKVLELRGTKNPYFSCNRQDMRNARLIGDSGYFAEADLTPNEIVRRCHALLTLFGYSPDDLQIETA